MPTTLETVARACEVECQKYPAGSQRETCLDSCLTLTTAEVRHREIMGEFAEVTELLGQILSVLEDTRRAR
jgi:hypothetical protein